MILNSTLKTIRVVLGEVITTNECDVTASWGDYAGALFLPGSADSATNGTTPVTIVGAPGTSEQRLVQEITVYNRDTVPHTVILQLDNNATIRVFRSEHVAAGGTLIYSPAGAGGTVDVPPALLLESGAAGLKISVLPAFDLTTPPDGTEKLPIVEAGVTDAATLAQLYTLIAAWTNIIATNPLDAPGASNQTGLPVVLQAGAGDGAGDGGQVSISSGTGGATGNGGSVAFAAGGSATGNGGDVRLDAGAGGGSGIGGSLLSNAGNSVDGNGGDVNFRGGTASGTGVGGSASVGGGLSGAGAGAAIISANGGGVDATDAGGGAWLTCGDGVTNGQGGDVHLLPGAGAGAGRAGLIIAANLPTVDPGVSNAVWVDPVTHLLHLSP